MGRIQTWRQTEGDELGPVSSRRCFVGVGLSSEWRTALMASRSAFKRADSTGSVRWVSAEKFHLTLLFLGTVGEATLGTFRVDLQAALADAERAEVQLGAWGAFPEWSRARVLWAGVEDPSGSLRCLHDRVAAAWAPHSGTPPESRFRPHITVGRTRRGLSPTLKREFQSKPSLKNSPAMAVKEVTLFESPRQPGPYRALATFPIGGG